MRRPAVVLSFLLAVSASSALAGGPANYAADRQAAREFTRLPEGVHFPEGIAADPGTGDLFVSTFDFGGNNRLLRFHANGKLAAQRDFGATPLLGLAYNPVDGKIYICNTGDLVGDRSRIQRIVAGFDGSTPVEEVAELPRIGPPPDRGVGNPDGTTDTIRFGNAAAAPNALAFRSDGALYVSDSFQGAIFRVADADLCAGGCTAETVVHDGLLATAGFPPFGANGIAFGPDEAGLFVANTGDDRILKVDLASNGVAVFAESINGADGIAFDAAGNLWAAANQADEIVVLNENGAPVAKLGDFQGIDRGGAPRGLLFPASIVFSRGDAYVTNLALPLTAAAGDEPEEAVRVYTISRIKGPELRGGHRR